MTKIQLQALRGMLNCNYSKSAAIEAGIDTCRSDTYKAALKKFHVEQSNCLDYYKRKEMRPPRAEPVQGATELRQWLSAEYDRIMLLREKRAKLKQEVVTSTLRQRCLNQIYKKIKAAYTSCNYRRSESRWTGGKHFVEILVGQPIASAHGYTEKVWSNNGKWSGTNSTHKITIMASWYNRVYMKGVSHVDGLLTLDAMPSQAEPLKPGEEALEATWVVQGRGVSLHTEDGILYRRHGGAWIHGTSVKNARSLNNKRLRVLAEERAGRIKQAVEAQEEMAKLSNIIVTREDCLQAGLCDPGKRDWLCKRGLDEQTQAVPAPKLLEMAILSGDRVDCVRRAIRVAVNRYNVASIAA